MNPVQLVMLVSWTVFFAYWFISATSVKSTQETRGWLGGNWYRILLFAGFLFMIQPKFLARLGIPLDKISKPILLPSTAIDILTIVLLAGGLIVAILARRTIARNWSVAVSFQKEHELITSGPYRFVRHPIYTGILLMVLGTTLSLNTLGAWMGFFIVLTALLIKLRQEEVLLTEHFPEDYPAYKQHTRALLPFLF